MACGTRHLQSRLADRDNPDKVKAMAASTCWFFNGHSEREYFLFLIAIIISGGVSFLCNTGWKFCEGIVQPAYQQYENRHGCYFRCHGA
jgi:hypothetical protein